MIRAFAILVTLLMSTAARGDELYVIGGFARGADIAHCTWIQWDSDVLFYNSANASQEIRVLNVSNGWIDAPTDRITVPPKSVVSLDGSDGKYWRPNPREHGFVPLWMWKFDVPATIQVTSFLELSEHVCPFPEAVSTRGQVRLPSFDRLASPGEEQVLLGADLSSRDRRINVAIYNAAPVPATARVIVRRICDGSELATEVITIPSDTVIQRGSVHSGTVPYWSCSTNPARGTYVTVVVDQPSIAWVSALANDEATTVTLNVIP